MSLLLLASGVRAQPAAPAAAQQVAAQPVQMDRNPETNAPERPSLVLRVQGDALVQDLSLVLLPGPVADRELPGARVPETKEQKLLLPALTPGKPVTVQLGSGRPGRTLWHGQLRYRVGDRAYSLITRFETLVHGAEPAPKSATPGHPAETPRGRVGYDYQHLDLKARFVEVQLTGARRGSIVAIGEDGAEIGRGEADWKGPTRAGAWLRLPWTAAPGREAVRVLRLELTLTDAGGLPVRATLIPWSVEVPHEEVNFATGRWDIPEAERAKLERSLQRIAGVVDKVRDKGVAPRLYVMGHTDTVGSDGDNLTLSQNRARSIAGYLREHGLGVPVLYAGAGERLPRVRTPDNTDEPQNRRADYVLSAGPPPLPAGARWTPLGETR